MSVTPAHAETTVIVRLTDQEISVLRQLSQAENLPQDVLLRKWVLDGLGRMRLERAYRL